MIDERAVIDPSAILGKNVKVGPYAIIGANVTLGDNCEVAAHATIMGRSVLGQNNKIYLKKV